ncbi:MAG TPA: RNA polymerase subunit sigma-70 [Rikenellaceae bacterium]|nr:RNA polymerase subunit sigma-70 [Rikenellaceae bacterium]
MNNYEQGFINFINENRNIIYKICFLYSNKLQSHDDLYQEVIINLWNAWPKFRGECKVQTWVYRISLNTCVSFLRRSKARPDSMPLTKNIEVIADEGDMVKVHELYRLIGNLGKLEKAIVLLYIEERSHDEISNIIGISRSNVAVKLFRIKEKLKLMSEN